MSADKHGIKDPTLRKIRNRGYTPVRYYASLGAGESHREEYRHGWLTGEETRAKVQIRLIGEDGNRWIRKEEMRHVTVL